VVIALGSNLGDREDNLRRAITAIGDKMRLVAVSSIYETEPMYLEGQDWFLNCVVVVETELEPLELLRWLKTTEERLGRDRQGTRNGPRIIDMDILFYGERVISEPGLLDVPHPKVPERAFVLAPLNEVRPRLLHPVSRKSVAAMLDDLGTRKKVVKRADLLADVSPSAPLRRPGPPAASPSRRASVSD
jgi:2-amino-4-hydroxy-6-hydroxymethyldihydropteridine diphosphokinase